MKKTSRRRFLQRGLELGAGAFLAGCSGPVREDANPAFLKLPISAEPGRVTLGLYRSQTMDQVCARVIPQLTDLKWLKRGDSVFLKLASNSPNEHPAVTSPAAVAAVARFFIARGAKVYAGDQAGVEHVRLTKTGRVSSTREVMQENGLARAIKESGAVLHCFDDHGWDGYFEAKSDFSDHYGGSLWLPKILQQVDHVVNLPRLGAHALAGYTCGVKIAVGWLRDDSRLVLHQKGKAFFELVAEIPHFEALRDKHRLTLTLGEQALLNIGPDVGSKYSFDGVLALGSTRLVDHDLVASALLGWCDEDDTSFWDLYAPYPEDADHWNRGLVEDTWGEEALEAYTPMLPFRPYRGLEYDTCLSHLSVLQGYRPQKIVVAREKRAPLPAEMVAHLKGFGRGVFSV